ncbi:hypothetical protein GCM10010095_65400 [Streptomyces anthocyanicus]|uniref:hypothetical protein n=1 Tax=Streptomyces anthocyanicus TaxID=68174 RepID=UPI0019A0E032|nr:hypothetical protein [Streptomyces anthocyanicus]GGL71583.1 hypothetical protein GCM10010095_65400 [Streptomyces anthocyanicus]
MNGPLDILGRAAYPPQPLGGDIAGRVTGSSVTVQLPCEEGTAEDKSVRALWARAEVMPRRGSQVSGHDRDILADTAVETANNLADRLGCADRLPNAPDHVPALTAGPVPAARAEGTCAWYGKTGLADRSPYPDEVAESRTDGRVWDESCGLVLSLGHANRVYEKLADAHDWLPTPDMPGEWFVSLHTYTGPVAENLRLTSADDGETPEPAVPGEGEPRRHGPDLVGLLRLRRPSPGPHHDPRPPRLRQARGLADGGRLPRLRRRRHDPPPLHGRRPSRPRHVPRRLGRVPESRLGRSPGERTG